MQAQHVFRRTVHVYSYVAVSKEADFSTALKECMDDLSSERSTASNFLDTNFSANPSIAFMFSSHRTFQESVYKRFYDSFPWLKIGCFVPKITDDSTKHMCISGFLIDGVDKPLTVTKDLDQKKMKLISQRESPKLFFKSYTSSFYSDISKVKSPTGIITSRNTSLLHDPEAVDTLMCEGGIEYVYCTELILGRTGFVWSSTRRCSKSSRWRKYSHLYSPSCSLISAASISPSGTESSGECCFPPSPPVHCSRR